MLDEIFNDEGNVVSKNITFIEKSFDCWRDIENIPQFFSERVSTGDRNQKNFNKHSKGKIITYYEPDFFGSCRKYYGITESKNFNLNKTIMLYAFLCYLWNREKISDADFRRRIRIVNNLINNSLGGEISNSNERQGRNTLPSILRQVFSIVNDGKITLDQNIVGGRNFSKFQLEEEQQKIEWTARNPDCMESLFELEDHYLLDGQISIVGLNNLQYSKRFISLFKCDYDLINRALCTKGEHFQNYSKYYQFGSNIALPWKTLFHHGTYVKNADQTFIVLNTLLSERENFSDDYLKSIIEEYLKRCERDKIFIFKVSLMYFRHFGLNRKIKVPINHTPRF